MAIDIAEISKSKKPRNSAPIFKAINIEYSIAVKTPNHSRIKFFVNFMNIFTSENEISLYFVYSDIQLIIMDQNWQSLF